MVDLDGNIEEADVDFIQTAIQNNGLNVSKSIDKLTKELRMYNALKLLELAQLTIAKNDICTHARQIISEYLEDK